MSDPARLSKDPDVDPALRADLQAYADAPPPALDYQAGLAGLGARIGGGAPSGGSPLALGAGAVAVAIVIGVAWWASREAPPPARVADTSIEAPSAVPAAAVPDLTPPPAIAAVGAPEPPVAPSVAATPQHREHVATAPATEPMPEGDRLALEMRLVSRARRALDASPSSALDALDRADREVGAGTFDEERSAMRILALAALGRQGEASQLGHAFLAQHPSGLFGERVRRALAPTE